VRLTQIEVDQDGSTGGTEWRFDVFLNDRVVIRLPRGSYDDDVGRYPLRSDDPSLEFDVTGDDVNIEIRVTGQRSN
jgi:hypothetical protein